jgi:hypothetical protein
MEPNKTTGESDMAKKRELRKKRNPCNLGPSSHAGKWCRKQRKLRTKHQKNTGQAYKGR